MSGGNGHVNNGSSDGGDGAAQILAGKIAVVTGASRGIGFAIARLFAGAGASVAICARAADAAGKRRLEEAAAALGEDGARIFAQPCDVAIHGAVAQFHGAVAQKIGTPDIVCNNAGTVVRKRLEETSEGDWDDVVGANLKGTFNVTRAFLPAMRARRSGRVINVASISGRQGTARLTAYCAAKQGVVGFTRALAEEVRDDGIQVNAVCPGSVDTDMLRGSGFEARMSAIDVANVVLYLAGFAPPALTGACVDVFG
jgi:NAD(P)-dependent dehydrogenase (short-subunit alcohol dehydrogenase family)